MARRQTGTALYRSSTHGSVSGSRKITSPVSRFQAVCAVTRPFPWWNPQRRFPILTAAMSASHAQSQPGTASAGRSFPRAAARKTASAAVSSRAPKVLAEPVLRAMGPSAMSVRPQSAYKAQKPGENTGRASNPRLPKIRQAVSKFAACLRRSI